MDRVVKTINKIMEFPYFFTVALPSFASIPTAIYRIKCLEDLAVELAPVVVCGGLLDALRYSMTKDRIKSWKKQQSNIAKVLDSDYFYHVVKLVKEYYGYKGNFITLEAIGEQEGTAVFQRGYFTRLNIHFEDGNVAKLFFKYSDKKQSDIGAKVSMAMHELGYQFVPMVFIPNKRTKIDSSIINRGQIFEQLNASSLENILIRGEDSKITRQVINSSFVNEIFSEISKYIITNN